MVDTMVTGDAAEALELDGLERRISRLTQHWIACLAAQLEELGTSDSERAARRAAEAAEVLDGLTQARDGVERMREVLR